MHSAEGEFNFSYRDLLTGADRVQNCCVPPQLELIVLLRLGNVITESVGSG